MSLKATYISPTRWSPLIPVDSGVAPLPTFSHASMDLQMCTPLSLTRVVLITLLPLAFRSLDTESPRRLFLMWPRCRGLLVFGDENSTMMFLPVVGRSPKSLSATISPKSSFQNRLENNRLRKPLTQLYSEISGTFAFSHSPMALPVFSGVECDRRSSGKTTSVKSPVNSFLVTET